VTGNEEDPDMGNNSSSIESAAAPSGYIVSKKATTPHPHVRPGDTVTYTVTVTNTGETAYNAVNPATFTDDLSDVLDDAALIYPLASGLSLNADGVTLEWSGELAAAGDTGDSVTVTYQVVVDSPVTGNSIMNNSVTATHAEGGCGGVCQTQIVVGIPGYTIEKSVDKITVTPDGTLPNDWVTWTIAVTNTGSSPYTSHHPASIEDDLSDVLDDAVFGNVISATTGIATIQGSTLSWSGPLAVGATAYITYQVRVNIPNAASNGNLVMNNVAVPLNSEGVCIVCAVQTNITVPNTFVDPLVPPDPPSFDAPDTGTGNYGADFAVRHWYLPVLVIAGVGVVVGLLRKKISV